MTVSMDVSQEEAALHYPSYRIELACCCLTDPMMLMLLLLSGLWSSTW